MRDRIYLFFIATYFAQGMIGVAYEPISYLLKDELGLTAGESASFIAAMTLPFVLKPLLGALTDALPLAGLRRRPYLWLSSAGAAASWLALAALPGYAYGSALALLTAANLGLAFSDVLCDGVMVERGRPAGKTGLYQAAQIAALYLALLATGLGGGWLAQHASYRAVFALTAAFPLLILAASFLVAEAPAPPAARQARRAWTALKGLLVHRRFWTAAAVILLFNFSPHLGTSMFYYQSETLGLSKVVIGALASLSGLAGVLGAGLFARLYRRLDTAPLVRLSVVLGAPMTLLYLAYRGPWSAAAVTAVWGTAGVAMRLSLMDWAARIAPSESEATAFAALISFFNLAAWGSNAAGAKLYAVLAGPISPHGAMAALTLVGAACVASCWPLARSLRLAPRERAG